MDSLEHGLFGWTKKDHKYDRRERGKNGKWKYFYKKVGSAVKKAVQSVGDALSNLINKHGKKKVSEIKNVSDNLLNSLVGKNKNVKVSSLERFDKEVTSKVYKYVAKVPLGNGKFRYFYSDEEYARYQNRQKVLDKDYDFMQDVPVLAHKDTAANAAYAADVGTDRGNCGSCSLAFELRMRGYDVKSSADVDGVNYMDFKDMFVGYKETFDQNWRLDTSKYKNYYNKGFLGLQKTTEEEKLQIAKEDLEKSIRERGGDNQRGFFEINWTRTDPDDEGVRHKSGGGHVFNYVVENGVVKFYDAQKGNANNQTGGEIDIATYLDNTDYTYGRYGGKDEKGNQGIMTYCGFFRVDNLDLNTNNKKYISYNPEPIHDKPEEKNVKYKSTGWR